MVTLNSTAGTASVLLFLAASRKSVWSVMYIAYGQSNCALNGNTAIDAFSGSRCCKVANRGFTAVITEFPEAYSNETTS